MLIPNSFNKMALQIPAKSCKIRNPGATKISASPNLKRPNPDERCRSANPRERHAFPLQHRGNPTRPSAPKLQVIEVRKENLNAE
jgi:hypothetical protein